MQALVCQNPRCRSPLSNEARFCARCGRPAGGVVPRRRSNRSLFKPVILIVLIVVFGSLFARKLQQRQPPSPPPPQSIPSITSGAVAEREAQTTTPLFEGSMGRLPPFAVTLGDSLRRFQILRTDWHSRREPWGDPGVLAIDLRPVRAISVSAMPTSLRAWCSGDDPVWVPAASLQWGSDSGGSVLHVLIDFSGVQHLFHSIQLEAG